MKRLAALTILAALALAPAAAAATQGAVFGLRAVGNPKLGYFVYKLPAGGTKSGAIIVSNSGDRRGTVKLYAADGGTGQTTGTVYLTNDKPQRAGAWVELGASSLTLAPGKFRRVPFTVRVPAGTKPGQWVGGIVAETATTTQSQRTNRKAGVQIRIRNQTIVAVQVDVPGPRRASFEIGAVKTGGQRNFQQLIVGVENTGNVLAKPSGSVTISRNGTVLQTLPFTMDTFLPQTSIDYPILLKKALAAGDYDTKVTLSYPAPGGGTRTATAAPKLEISNEDVKQVFTSAAPTQQPPTADTSSGGDSPPWALIGAGVAALVVLLALVLLLRRRRRRDEPAAEAPVEPLQPLPPLPPVRDEPVEPEPTFEPEPAVAAEPPPRPRPASCDPHHYWEVAYERGKLGDDGVWRFPHRCQNCGLELLATDIADASAQADRLQP